MCIRDRFFNLRRKKKTLDWLTKDEAEKIADDLNVEVKDVLHMENRLSSNDSSFDGPADTDDDEKIMSPSQYLEDKRFDPAIMVEADEVAEMVDYLISDKASYINGSTFSINGGLWMD